MGLNISTKKIFLSLVTTLSFILFLMHSSIVFASDPYDIAYNCPEGCVKDKPITWFVNITNLGEEAIYVIYMRTADNINLETIVEIGKIDTTDTSEMVRITQGTTHSFELQGLLPNPNQGLDLIYRLCIIQRVPFEIWTTIGDNIEYCYKTNHTIPMLDCILDTDCDDNKYCKDNTCIPLNCTECQYFEENKCVDYECCSNNDCSLNKVCIEHNCELLDCGNEINQTNNQTETNESLKQYAVNHTCSPEPCANDEIIIDYACVKANCGEDEFLSDYECKKLDCSPDEGSFNHTCIKLNCKETEAMLDHRCVPLECEDDEVVISNVCTKLNCGFFQKAESHRCLINTNLFIESILFFVMASLFVLDVKKYNGKHRKKLVSMLLKKAKERGGGNKSKK